MQLKHVSLLLKQVSQGAMQIPETHSAELFCTKKPGWQLIQGAVSDSQLMQNNPHFLHWKLE